MKEALMRKRVWIPAAAIAAAAGITAGIGTGLIPAAAGPSGESRISSIAPDDSETLVIAPANDKWWDRVAPLMQPSMKIDGLDPDDAGLDLEYIGYSRSVNHNQAGQDSYQSLRRFYVEAANEEDAQAAARWLSTAEGSENRRVDTDGDVVIVSHGSGGEFKRPARSVADVLGETVTPDGSKSSMFKNPQAEGYVATGSADSVGAEALSAVYTKGLGLDEKTTWVGTSSDGEEWTGGYRAGGSRADRLDFSGLGKQLEDYAEPVFEAQNDTTYYKVFLSSPADIATSTFIASPHLKDTFGYIPMENPPAPGVAGKEVSTMNYMPKHVSSSAGEIQGELENLETVGVSAGEKEMVVTLGFKKR